MARWLRRPVVWVPVCAALLLVLAWRSRVWEAASLLPAPDAGLLALAVALNGIVLLLWAIRSAALLRATGARIGVVEIVPLTALANTLNNLTPGSSGELVRLWILRASHGVPYVSGAAVILIERFVAIAYLGATAGLAWLGWLLGLPAAVVGALMVIVAIAPAAAYGAGVRPLAAPAALPLGRLVGAARWARIAEALRRVDQTIASILRDARTAAVLAATSGGIFATYAAQVWLVARSLGVTLDPVLGWGALGISIVAGVVSLLPFGLGAADVVFAVLLGALGVPGTSAAAIVFGNRLVSTLPLGIAGIAGYAWCSAMLPDHSARRAMEEARRDLGSAGPEIGP